MQYWFSHISSISVGVFLLIFLLVFGYSQIRQCREPQKPNRKHDQPPDNLRNGKDQAQAAPENNKPQQCWEKEPLSHRLGDHDHPTEAEQRTAEQLAWRVSKNLGIWTGVAASAAAFFAFWTWYETKRQADTANLALVAVQRAYVTSVGLRFDPVRDKAGELRYWQAYLTVQDTGVTPTRFLRAFGTHMTFYKEILQGREPDANLFDLPLTPIFGYRLGPQEKIEFGPMPVYKSDIQQATSNEDSIVFWGVAEYNDVFPDTPRGYA